MRVFTTVSVLFKFIIVIFDELSFVKYKLRHSGENCSHAALNIKFQRVKIIIEAEMIISS